MFNPEKYAYLKSLGFNQEPHGIPMYRILYSIQYLDDIRQLATANRISVLIEKYPSYCHKLLNVYWGWKYVSKKPIKISSDTQRKSGGSSFHWTLTKNGRKKLMKLKERFGAMVEVEDKK